MKRLLFLLPILAFTQAVFAQNDCSKDHPVYKTGSTASPKTVYSLGSNPEFPFLRNLSSPRQVLAALKSKENARKYPRQMKELNRMLVEIGFSDGVNDVTLNSISADNISSGTTGNMGDGHLNYEYTRLEGNHRGWKISSGGDCAITFLAKCGNAFYPYGAENATAYTGHKPCKDVDVNVSSEPKEVKVDPARYTTKKIYVYYRRCHCEACGDGWSETAYNNGLLSRPLLVKKEEITGPLTYKVSASNTGHVTMCGGQPTGVTTALQVETENEYSGYRPNPKKEYVEVTKREYKRAQRDKELMRDLEQRPHLAECTTCR